MEDRRFTHLLRRLREAPGCTRYCAPTGGELLVVPLFRLVHNGVSFSRRTDVDMFLLRPAEDDVVGALTCWLRAHHAGDQSQPFRYVNAEGREIIVPEADRG